MSVSVGDYPIPLADVVPALLGLGDEATTIVARELRLPRVLGGLLVGGAFGLSGAIFQAVARNPLASPDILGVLQGGSVAAVFGITVLGASAALVSVSAFAGALAMTIAVYVLAYRQGVSSYRFVLVGIGLAAIGTALVNCSSTRADIFSASGRHRLAHRQPERDGWESVVPTAVAFAGLTAVALVLCAACARCSSATTPRRGSGWRSSAAGWRCCSSGSPRPAPPRPRRARSCSSPSWPRRSRAG